MRRKITIDYYWKNSAEPEAEIPQDVQEALEESAMERIREMMDMGFVMGELHDMVRMSDTDPEDGVEYSGHWGAKTETITDIT